MEYKVACLMCEGTGEDDDIPEAGCMSCCGDGYIEVSKAEYEEYHKNVSKAGNTDHCKKCGYISYPVDNDGECPNCGCEF